MSIEKHIPNFFTSCNLLCGCIGIVQVFNDNIFIAATLIWIGAAFDFLDGFAARLLKSNSEIGLQLDSLADMITFGLLPASIVYQLLADSGSGNLAYIAFVIAVFTALRLAKFNVKDTSSSDFIGLPSPSSAFLVSALPFYFESDQLNYLITPRSLTVISLVLSFLMVSSLKLYSLKIKTISWQNDKWKITSGAISLILLITYKVFAIPAIIITYIITSILDQYTGKSTVKNK